MSRAFVKERDDLPPDAPPELAISDEPNLVTPRGLRLIETRLFELKEALDAGPDDALKARLLRDLRYWTARRASAQLVEHTADYREVVFGSEVTIRRHDGPPETWEIVGEDEADPKKGKISHTSPIAAALMGARAGETVELAHRKPPLELEILSVR
ncbi:MAG TPA: GreA/GreB family elongation factor [Rhizomicrobium sp.]|jgi:transcription elongation GreA/GreB family factor|nr:GreA/GreB family elongation factor [Rhizomicrobium sp.]